MKAKDAKQSKEYRKALLEEYETLRRAEHKLNKEVATKSLELVSVQNRRQAIETEMLNMLGE